MTQTEEPVSGFLCHCEPQSGAPQGGLSWTCCKMSCNTPKNRCHPERLKKIADFRKESKDLRTNLTAKVPSVRRSFDSLRSLRMTGFGCPAKTAFCNTPNSPSGNLLVECCRFVGTTRRFPRPRPRNDIVSMPCLAGPHRWSSKLVGVGMPHALQRTACRLFLQASRIRKIKNPWQSPVNCQGFFLCVFAGAVRSRVSIRLEL